ncbi:hypothetical protein HNR06_001630 [Nocardiopsis arvandica]|uniref:Uncharacterized protein n=1 Tax=Nocardiopsis sinuspersici TaxID=501010 RepID=A0A7Y9XA58_9ACTN|nr:hypothetical protein [Nocardiopsis sinuspersici]NYH52041.1 hypothetical protein [Nocardiopsis sinuspersici]
MSLEAIYGTQPELLPRSMVRLAVDRSSGRRCWKARSDIEIIGLDSYVLLARESIRRFPWKPDTSIDWDSLPEGMDIWSSSSEDASLDSFTPQVFPDPGDLVFFWEPISVPSVKVKAKEAPVYHEDIEEAFSNFWVYSIEGSVLVEKSFSGVMTASKIPPHDLFAQNIF